MYRERIEKLAPGYDPAHVEAWMLVHNGILDALLPLEFEDAVLVACKCIDAVIVDQSDAIALRKGLKPRSRKATT
jgi:hypothetical protein